VDVIEEAQIENTSFFVVFGPEDYTCYRGKPETIAETFSIPDPDKVYFIRIYKGG